MFYRSSVIGGREIANEAGKSRRRVMTLSPAGRAAPSTRQGHAIIALAPAAPLSLTLSPAPEPAASQWSTQCYTLLCFHCYIRCLRHFFLKVVG